MIEIIRPGPLATIQDLGRPGHAAIGVGRSGAADKRSLIRANLLVGNDPGRDGRQGEPGAAAIEVTLGGLLARFDAAATVAVTGAPSSVTSDGVPIPFDEPVEIVAGAAIRLGTPRLGLRTYVAVRGGLDAQPVLGSRSTDVLSGLGPAVLTAGAEVPIGTAIAGAPGRPVGSAAPLDAVVGVLPGPRLDWFDPRSMEILSAGPYVVTKDSNRVGLRLSGPELPRARAGELAPEGIVAGAIQVPPDGRPVLFLADHPTTGGYPVVAVVVDEHIWKVGQVRPGQRLEFRPAGIAHRAY